LDKSGLDLGVIYESDYIMKSDIDMPIIAANNYQPTTYPGSRLPHFELIRNSTTISSLDLISTEFVMLCETNAVSHAKQIDFKTIITKIIAIDDTNNTYEKEPGTFQKLHELNKSAALWVRPDGHIIWKGELNKADDIKNLDELIQILVKK
jgi:putative polyketide hydroxylase